LTSKDFEDVGVDVRELKISNGKLKGISNHAFKNVQSLEKLDLSENSISNIENDAFAEVCIDISHSGNPKHFVKKIIRHTDTLCVLLF